jgi:hypothetical protein
LPPVPMTPMFSLSLAESRRIRGPVQPAKAAALAASADE